MPSPQFNLHYTLIELCKFGCNLTVRSSLLRENPPAPVSPFYSSMGASSHSHTGQSGILPILSAVRSFKPSSLLDPNYRRNFFNQIGASAFRNSSPVGSPVSNVGVTDLSDMRDHPGFRPLLHPDYRAGTYNASLYENYAEEHMIQAAIEASKQEVDRTF